MNKYIATSSLLNIIYCEGSFRPRELNFRTHMQVEKAPENQHTRCKCSQHNQKKKRAENLVLYLVVLSICSRCVVKFIFSIRTALSSLGHRSHFIMGCCSAVLGFIFMEVPYRLISIANVFSDFSCDAFHLNYTYILRLIVNIFMNNLLPFQAKHICLLNLHYLSLDLTQIGKLVHTKTTFFHKMHAVFFLLDSQKLHNVSINVHYVIFYCTRA